MLTRSEKIQISGTAAAAVLTGVLHFAGAPTLLRFVVAAAALSLLAMMIGKATESMGDRLGPAATGMLQSAFGNLPEIFVCIFSLKAGMVDVVQAALVGSIMANALLVLGVAILWGGLKHGRQRFRSDSARMSSTLILLAVAGMVVPTLAAELHTPAELHLDKLSAVCAVFLLIVFGFSIPYSIKAEAMPTDTGPESAFESAEPAARETEPAVYVRAPAEHGGWPLGFAISVLAIAGIAAAGVSDWFVVALEPTIHSLGLSQAFAGFVIVAIAGNAVENVVGIQLAAANKPEYAMSVILNSSLQIALAVVPILVLLSYFVIGGTVLTLVMPPLLIAGLLLTALIVAFIVLDGETVWLEGVALIGLYAVIACTLWWG